MKETHKTIFLKHINVLRAIDPYMRHQPRELFRERARDPPGQSSDPYEWPIRRAPAHSAIQLARKAAVADEARVELRKSFSA